jgi:hypothetical protein
VRQVESCIRDWIVGELPINRAVSLFRGDGEASLFQNLYVALNRAFRHSEFRAKLLQGASFPPKEMSQLQYARDLIAPHTETLSHWV